MSKIRYRAKMVKEETVGVKRKEQGMSKGGKRIRRKQSKSAEASMNEQQSS